MKTLNLITLAFILLSSLAIHGQCDVYEVVIAPQANDSFATAEYTLWIPEGVDRVDRILLHQHGCSKWAQDAGRTVTDDLHWKALAEKTNSALLGSSLWPRGECSDWALPQNGSEGAFLAALDKLAVSSGHPEIATVNWAMWGHSGGGFWVQSMLQSFPERFDAAVIQSGGFSREDGIWGPEMERVPHSLEVPLLIHTGIGEKDHERFARTYDQSILFFRAMRKKGAPVSLAIDPASGHNAGNSRYLTIPWIYGALEGQKSDEVVWPSEHSADGNWFPSKTVGNAWKDFTATGMVSDQTAPRSAPFDLCTQRSYWGVRLMWDALPDWETGIKTFRIYRDGKLLPPYTALMRPIDKEKETENFRAPGNMDTPFEPLSQMMYRDTSAEYGVSYTYEVSMVNWAGLESERSAPIRIE